MANKSFTISINPTLARKIVKEATIFSPEEVIARTLEIVFGGVDSSPKAPSKKPAKRSVSSATKKKMAAAQKKFAARADAG